MAAFTATIQSNGQNVDPQYVLTSIDVSHEINRIPRAELVYLDGNSAANQFSISDSGVFDPGAQISIQIRYEDSPDTEIFTGTVVRQAVFADHDGSHLTIELKDPLFDLTTVRKNRVFSDESDSDIIAAILQDRAGTIQPTDTVHSTMVQYYSTDWDFILTRTDACGLLVNVVSGQMNTFEPDLSSQEDHRFDFGSGTILELELQADVNHHLDTAVAEGWDPSTQQTTEESSPTFNIPQGQEVMGQLPDSLKAEDFLESAVPLTADELDVWATARISKNRLAMLRGRFSIEGKPDITVGQLIKVSGISKVFDGITLATAVRHRVNETGWVTDVQFGLADEWFAEKHGVSASPAAGLLPPVSGLQIGKVADYEADPADEYRLKVEVPSLKVSGQDDLPTIWARVATFEAGTNHGAWFLPKVGDEVVIGFFNNDPRNPVILGSLYSSLQRSWVKQGRENSDRGFLTPGGLAIGFSDVDKEISLESPDGQKIQIIDGKGIMISSTKNVTIDAPKGNFVVNGKKIEITGDNFKTT